MATDYSALKVDGASPHYRAGCRVVRRSPGLGSGGWAPFLALDQPDVQPGTNSFPALHGDMMVCRTPTPTHNGLGGQTGIGSRLRSRCSILSLPVLLSLLISRSRIITRATRGGCLR